MDKNTTVKRRCGILFMIIGIALVSGAIFIVGKNIYNEKKAGEYVDEFLSGVKSEIENNKNKFKDMDDVDKLIEDKDYNALGAKYEYKEGMLVETIDEKEYIGIVDIPSADISLPVFYSFSYANIRMLPARYSGSYSENNMVVAAHNYKRHFKTLLSLETDTEIIFTTIAGDEIHYLVTDIERVMPDQVKYMTDNRDGEWDLTLFTCNSDGSYRCAVRCREK